MQVMPDTCLPCRRSHSRCKSSKRVACVLLRHLRVHRRPNRVLRVAMAENTSCLKNQTNQMKRSRRWNRPKMRSYHRWNRLRKMNPSCCCRYYWKTRKSHRKKTVSLYLMNHRGRVYGLDGHHDDGHAYGRDAEACLEAGCPLAAAAVADYHQEAGFLPEGDSRPEDGACSGLSARTHHCLRVCSRIFHSQSCARWTIFRSPGRGSDPSRLFSACAAAAILLFAGFADRNRLLNFFRCCFGSP